MPRNASHLFNDMAYQSWHFFAAHFNVLLFFFFATKFNGLPRTTHSVHFQLRQVMGGATICYVRLLKGVVSIFVGSGDSTALAMV